MKPTAHTCCINRLHDFKTQEDFYSKIVERYVKFCASFSDGEQLEIAFATLQITNATPAGPKSDTDAKRPSTSAPNAPSKADQTREMAMITMAMRKLREGCLGSGRRDAFAQKAYMFIIHVNILSRHWESYVPALHYLLREIHPVTALSEPDLEEFTSYHILDLACRQNDLLEAYTVRNHFGNRDRKVTAVLTALTHDNWVRYWRVLHAVDGYQRAILSFNNEHVRLHALKCIGRAYLSAERTFVEHSTDSSWFALVEQGVGWELQDNDQIVIRKPKAR